MTNTHRKTTNRTVAKVAAVGAFGIGTAIAFPGLAAAQSAEAPTVDAGSVEENFDAGSLDGVLDEALDAGSAAAGDLEVDLGSLTFGLNLDAETPNPGSVEFGSLGVSPNTGSDAVDNGSSGGDSGSLDAGSLGEGSLGGGSLGETGSDVETPGSDAADDTGSAAPGSDEAGDTGSDAPAAGSDEAGDTGSEAPGTDSLTGELSGLSSGAEAGAGVEVQAGTGSLG